MNSFFFILGCAQFDYLKNAHLWFNSLEENGFSCFNRYIVCIGQLPVGPLSSCPVVNTWTLAELKE